MPTPSKSRKPVGRKATAKVADADTSPPNGYGTGWATPLSDVQMPSGTLAQLRRPGVPGLVAAGVIDNLDALSNLVVEKHVKRARGEIRPKPTVDSKKLLSDPKAIKDINAVMEKIACYVVVQPQVRRAVDDDGKLVPEGQRDQLPPGVIWHDWMPYEDMVFIVNYAVGGTTDLAQFREEFSEVLGDVSAGKQLRL